MVSGVEAKLLLDSLDLQMPCSYKRCPELLKFVAEVEKSNKASDGSHKGERRTGRVLSLSDRLYRSEANSDALQDGPRSEREDSDFDEELELDFETSISGDEGRDVESNILKIIVVLIVW
ncbi:hypothetical protein J1N35_030015 [Gossypium stocksii]|uniref:Uncharacterized protein n=1 Tax=Gossypium stocksii TaxID=47602 RepID=A0A9D3UYV6_9ROSI|nr:hypothetical protein J1N35_030015 [Gossypium stocksii]